MPEPEIHDLPVADLKALYLKEVGEEAPNFLDTKAGLVYGIENHRRLQAAQRPLVAATVTNAAEPAVDRTGQVLTVNAAGEERWFNQDTWDTIQPQPQPWSLKTDRPKEDLS